MTGLRTVGADEIRARLGDLARPDATPPDPAPGSTGRWGLRQAAVLRGSFAVPELVAHVERKSGPPSESDLADFMEYDVTAVTTAHGPAWQMTPEARQSTVRHLEGNPRRLLATTRAVPPDPSDLGRIMAESYLSGSPPPVRAQSDEQLTGTLIALDWLSGMKVDLPTEAEVRRQLDFAALLQPLHVVTDRPIVGRSTELNRLADYVARESKPLTGGAQFRPLLIHGPGGIGKSTIIARFVLDVILKPPQESAFAYLTFDRPELLPQQPLGLLAEILRQLALQNGEISESATRAISALERNQHIVAIGQQQSNASRKSSAGSTRRYARDEQNLIADFVGVAAEAGADRIVCFLDTFERAQRQGQAAVSRLWSVLGRVAEELPSLRVVMAGRAAVGMPDVQEMVLGGLPDEVAAEYLHDRTADLNVSNRFLMTIAHRLDGNPLSLRLVTDLIRREHSSLHSPLGRHRFLLLLDNERVQGVLYRRVLDHIDDPDARALAVPGLALRKVSADVVREVLAPSIGLGRISAERAEELYQKLRRETSLVTDHGSYVVHRPDVRAEILPILANTSPKSIASLHRRAIRFYKRRDAAADRTEELYHRLALGQDRRSLDKRWTDDAGLTLDTALDELPSSSQAYLASRLRIELDQSIVQLVDDADWAEQAARSARAFLDADEAGAALDVLRSRHRSNPLPELDALEVEALARTGNPAAAMDVVERSRLDAADRGSAPDFIRFSLLGAQLDEDAGDFEQAMVFLAEARDGALGLGDAVNALVAGVGMLRIERRLGRPQDGDLRSQVFAEARELPVRDRRANPALARDLAAEGGSELPEFVIAAAKLVGIDVVSEQARAELIEQGMDEAVAVVDDIVSVGRSSNERDTDDATEEVWITSSELGTVMSEFLEQNPDERSFDALSVIYQTEADSPSFAGDDPTSYGEARSR